MSAAAGPAGPRLSIVTVLYRSAETLAETLPTWADSARGEPVEFVFVDNRPGDGCRKVIEDCLDDAAYRYLPDETNPGFAAGCNRAVRAAAAPHVLLLNPDVWLRGDSVARILDAVAASPATPLAISLTMRQAEYAGICAHPISLFNDRPAGSRRAPLGPSGGAAVFPVALLARFGGFHEAYFAWGEDADLAFRLFAAGVRTGSLRLELAHAWGHSVDGDGRLGEYRAYLLARNRVLVAARTFTWPLLLVWLWLMVIGHCGLGLRRVRQGLLRPFLAGVGRGVISAPGARRAFQGRRFGLASLLGYINGEDPGEGSRD